MLGSIASLCAFFAGTLPTLPRFFGPVVAKPCLCWVMFPESRSSAGDLWRAFAAAAAAALRSFGCFGGCVNRFLSACICVRVCVCALALFSLHYDSHPSFSLDRAPIRFVLPFWRALVERRTTKPGCVFARSDPLEWVPPSLPPLRCVCVCVCRSSSKGFPFLRLSRSGLERPSVEPSSSDGIYG